MKLARRNTSCSPWGTFQADMDRWMDRFFDAGFHTPLADLHTGPAVNVWETEDAYRVEAELPGVPLDDLSLDYHDHSLHIRGSYRTETGADNKETVVRRRERRTGRFQRSLRFAKSVAADAIEATLEGGILTVQLPKTAKAKSRRIDIQSREG